MKKEVYNKIVKSYYNLEKVELDFWFKTLNKIRNFYI